MIKKFSDSQPPAQEQETDRYEFKAGDLMVIDGILISPSSKYGKIGKANGYNLVTKERIKKRTTSKVIIQQLENMASSDASQDKTQLRDYYKVLVAQKKAEKSGRTFLSLEDPA